MNSNDELVLRSTAFDTFFTMSSDTDFAQLVRDMTDEVVRPADPDNFRAPPQALNIKAGVLQNMKVSIDPAFQNLDQRLDDPKSMFQVITIYLSAQHLLQQD
jgi:hypothetical protein